MEETRLTKLEFSHRGKDRHTYYHYLCSCGAVKVIAEYLVKRGNTKSCGCLGRENRERIGRANHKHGHSSPGKRSPTYRSWQSMKQRCSNPKYKGSASYAGRGITYDSKWETFEGFLEDMGERPAIEYSLDRIDNNGNYCKDNCQWITKSENSKKRWYIMANNLQHIHILVKAKIREPKALSISGLHTWVDMAVRAQKLAPIAGPFVTNVDDPGNEGPTGGVHIKTSHMAFHIWDNLNIIQADLYTCGELDIKKFINEFVVFDVVQLEYLVIDRADGFKIIKSGKINGFKENSLYNSMEELHA